MRKGSDGLLYKGIKLIGIGTCKDQIIIIPEGIKILGDFALKGCSSLISIEIPESVTSIGDVLFNLYF